MQELTSGGRWLRRITKLSGRIVLSLAVGAGLAAAQQPSPPAADTNAALARFLDDASAINSKVPERLRAYTARVETEMSLSVVDSADLERIAQVEQVASVVRWRATGAYEQRVVGHRSQAVGPMFSLMSMFGGWTTPTLYGNRLQLGVTPSSAGTRPEPVLP
ncbi:MAG TPA: hypothetical protein VFV33_13525, partial [Gemmatimonadaceae bacterium]|nr:hypothetical protein [Gemmatimonadaceae bacterium]